MAPEQRQAISNPSAHLGAQVERFIHSLRTCLPAFTACVRLVKSLFPEWQIQHLCQCPSVSIQLQALFWLSCADTDAAKALRSEVLALNREEVAAGLLQEIEALQAEARHIYIYSYLRQYNLLAYSVIKYRAILVGADVWLMKFFKGLSLHIFHLQGSLAKPVKEAASKAELKEAAFSIVKASHKEAKTRPYHEQLLRWFKQPVSIGEAYTQRAAIFSAANCFLQA